MLFAWTNAALVLLVDRLLPRVAPDGGPWARLSVALMLGLGLITGATFGLGLVGLLAPIPLAGLTTLGLLAALAADGRFGAAPRPSSTASGGALAGAGAALLGASASLWLARAGWRGTAFCFDDIVYHAAVPATWMQWGRIDHVAFTYQTYYPFNAELVSLWFSVPVGDPAHAGVAVLLYAALAIAATLAIGEALSVPLGPRALLLAAMFASPRMLYFARTYSATDLAMTAWLLGALALALGPRSRRAAVGSGLAAGAAIGCKVSAAPAAALLALWWGAGGLGYAALFVAATLPLGIGWYAHNLITTGNPLFPAEIGPFDGPLDRDTQHRTSLRWFFENRGHRPAFWGRFFDSRLDWPFPLGVAAAVGYVVGAAAGLLPGRRGAWLLVAVGVSFLLLHPLQPFSGTINRPNAGLHEMVRYLTLPFAIGMPLLASVTSPRDGTDRWVAGFGVLAWLFCVGQQLQGLPPAEVVGMAAGSALGLAVIATWSSWPRAVGPALALALVAALALRTGAKSDATREARGTFSRMGSKHADAWRAIDALPDGSQIAWISDLPGTHAFSLPLLGARLQHHLVAVDRHGEALRAPLHARWRDAPPGWWREFRRKPKDAERVLEGLLASGADHLVLTRCQRDDGGSWPLPRGRLKQGGVEHRVFGDRCVEIWALDGYRGRGDP